MSPEETARVLAAQREEAVRALAGLVRDVDEVVAASVSSNADDEHDPEGATIAFERSRLGSLVERARRRVQDVDDAAARLAAGTYGRCETCGGPVGDERLEALPATRRCRACA